MDNQFFKSVEKKTGVNMKDVLDLANSLQNANFKDEKTVRRSFNVCQKLRINLSLKKLKIKLLNRL